MFGVMHTEKYKRTAVYRLQNEDRRTEADIGKYERSGIDWTRTHENYHLIDHENWSKFVTDRLHAEGLKPRKDSNVMVGTVYSASPEFFVGKSPEEVRQYFEDCLDFHIKEYCQGDRSRVISAVVHLDETTPHMQVESIPLYQDAKGMHLSAKLVVGNRQQMRGAQDRFYEEVSKGYGLERGELVDWGKPPAERRSHKDKADFWKEESAKAERHLKDIQGKLSELIHKYNKVVVPKYNGLVNKTREKQAEVDKLEADIINLSKEYIQVSEASEAPEFVLERLKGYVRDSGASYLLEGFETAERERQRTAEAYMQRIRGTQKKPMLSREQDPNR